MEKSINKQSFSANKQSFSANKKVKSSKLQCGKRTYFFDVSVASNDKKYLKITESKFVEEGKDRIRNSLLLFVEDLANFQASLGDAVKAVI